MVSSEVKRTLVKSPPELWAELSDPAALARHLGDLGGDVENMRITRVHAEERVDWEAERISGTVLMKASGWGTKVTLRVSREVGEATEPEPGSDAIPPEASDVAEDQVEPAPEAPPEPSHVEETQSIEELLAATPVEPRRGFLSRFFRRRRPIVRTVAEEPLSEEEIAAAPDASADITASDAVKPATDPDPAPEASPDVSADLKAAEEVAAEEVTAVLTATLDRLGAAHHRPFSRS